MDKFVIVFIPDAALRFSENLLNGEFSVDSLVYKPIVAGTDLAVQRSGSKVGSTADIFYSVGNDEFHKILLAASFLFHYKVPSDACQGNRKIDVGF
jgi:hypothetical protein